MAMLNNQRVSIFIQRLGCTFAPQDEFQLDIWRHLWRVSAHPICDFGHVETSYRDIIYVAFEGTPKSSILIGYSLINQPTISGIPHLWKPPYSRVKLSLPRYPTFPGFSMTKRPWNHVIHGWHALCCAWKFAIVLEYNVLICGLTWFDDSWLLIVVGRCPKKSKVWQPFDWAKD